jgi:hypothetical protein
VRVSEPPAAVPLASRLPPPAQLPADLADFTGRASILSQARTGLGPADESEPVRTATRMALITGMPGVGKTALAVHMAHRLRPYFEDGQLYADLSGSSAGGCDPAAVLRGFLRALGLAPAQIPDGLQERCKLFRSTTAGRSLLVVLDGAGSLADVRPLLPGDARCAVIITSRRRLHGLGGAWSVDLDVLDHAESIELLARMVGPARVERERAAADRLVELVGRLPLALRCVGGRLAAVPGLALGSLAEQLAGSRQTLDELRLGDLNVRSIYDASYDRLSRMEQSTFRLLSMLPSAEFNAETAAELLGWEMPMVERLLERFVDDHLLRVKVVRCDNDEIYYTFPRLVRIYARARLDSTLGRNPQVHGAEELPWAG